MTGRGRTARHSRKRERGQAFVELAIAVPLLFILVFAVIEFGLIISDQETVTHAAWDGARVGARGDSPTNQSSAQTQATSYLGDLNRCPSPSVSVTYDEQIPDQVHVTVSCTYSPLTPLGSFITSLFSSPLTISSTTVMRVQ
jgi:Flp pilus assembly protein TadG